MPNSPLQLPQDRVVNFCKKYHIATLALFGSILTDKFGPQSDIDFLVEFEKKHIPTLFDMVDMEEELSSILGRQVDLRTANDLSPYFRSDVLSKAQLVYVRS